MNFGQVEYKLVLVQRPDFPTQPVAPGLQFVHGLGDDGQDTGRQENAQGAVAGGRPSHMTITNKGLFRFAFDLQQGDQSKIGRLHFRLQPQGFLITADCEVEFSQVPVSRGQVEMRTGKTRPTTNGRLKTGNGVIMLDSGQIDQTHVVVRVGKVRLDPHGLLKATDGRVKVLLLFRVFARLYQASG